MSDSGRIGTAKGCAACGRTIIAQDTVWVRLLNRDHREEVCAAHLENGEVYMILPGASFGVKLKNERT